MRLILMKRLKRESSVWGALKHPNIVEFLGCATDPMFGELPALVSNVCKLDGNYLHKKFWRSDSGTQKEMQPSISEKTLTCHIGKDSDW